MRTTILKLSLLAILLVLLAAATACSADTAMGPKPDLSCNNPIATPAPIIHLASATRDTVVAERYAIPLHWADTVRVFTDSTGNPDFDRLAAAGGARAIFLHGGRCTTVSDSLVLYTLLRRVP